MATLVMQAYYGTGGTPTWQAVGANRLTFNQASGTGTTTAAAIDAMPINTWQSGTHVASTTPTDQCTNPHVQNFKYISTTQWQITTTSGGVGATASLADASVGSGVGGSFRWQFSDSPNRQIQNPRLYVFDGSGTVTNRATNLDVAMFVGGQVAASPSVTTWYKVNDDTTTGPTGYTTGGIGGDNSGSRISGATYLDRSSAATNEWYCATSVSVETAGAKTAFAYGIYVEYI